MLKLKNRGIDVILKIIGTIGTAGGTGFVIEFAGEVIRNLSIEERMTVCNMTIEAGARAGLIAPDEKTFEYFKNNGNVFTIINKPLQTYVPATKQT